jgi:DNA-binding NarL/FixJ family response regulator
VIRVLVADDHEVVRAGVTALVDRMEDLEICAATGDADEAVSLVDDLRPDVVLMDVRFGPGATDGIEATRAIRQRHPDVGVVVLTSFHDDDALFAAIAAGAGAVVLKDLESTELVSAIRHVAAGESVLDPAVTASVLDRLRGAPGALGDAKLGRLSPRELEILALVAEGRTNREIAERLHLSEKTIKNNVTHLLAKLDVGRRSEAASYYARHRGRLG